MKAIRLTALLLALVMLTGSVLVSCDTSTETPATEPETVVQTEPETEAQTLPETTPETLPETKAPETKAPETKAPETKAPETKAPETKAPETKAPETKAPETKAPETKAPETKAPETKAPETKAPETKAPETKAPETKAPETKAPETKAPETKAPETKAPETKAPETEEVIVGTHLVSPANGATVPMITDFQRNFIAMDHASINTGDINWSKLGRKWNSDRSQPEPTVFEWKSDQKTSLLEISEDPTFASLFGSYTVEGMSQTVINFKTGTTYYWRVNGGDAFSFTTEAGVPRFIGGDTLSNVRDIGWLTTEDGTKIRQGIVFRGSELDSGRKLTKNDVSLLHDKLGIKTEIDLRGESTIDVSPIGKDVKYFNYGAMSYVGFLSKKADIRYIFQILSKEKYYPIYFHCQGGADRAGTLAILLEALLGVSEENICLDYELTSLSVYMDRSRNTSDFMILMNNLKRLPGETLSEKVEHFLVSDAGVKQEEIDSIRNNLLIK